MEADAESNLKQAFLDVNQVQTLVIQYGLNEMVTKINRATKSPLSNHKHAIVFIPGNPGSIQFYEHFLESIYKQLKIPVIGVSHSGHVTLDSKSAQSAQDDYSSVNGQILHKLLFIERFIPKDVNLIFIGHSLGAYIILEMLKTIGKERNVVRNILVFPVIERLHELSRSKLFSLLFSILFFPILIMVFFLNLFSVEQKQRIVRLFMKYIYGYSNYPDCVINGGCNFFDINVVKNIMTLFCSEFQQIRDLQMSLIESRIKTLSLMYGDMDSWCPLRFYEEISQRFPNEDITLAFKKIPHAFVLDKQSTYFVTKVVCDNIRNYVLNNSY